VAWRAHCDAGGRDYDDITKTCYFIFDPAHHRNDHLVTLGRDG
jgi:hypothetical protein